jgi:hypothetical protein
VPGRAGDATLAVFRAGNLRGDVGVDAQAGGGEDDAQVVEPRRGERRIRRDAEHPEVSGRPTDEHADQTPDEQTEP